MKTTFVRVVTKDNLILQGLLYEPGMSSRKIIIHTHGMAGNFYENRFLDAMAQEYIKAGWAFLTVNNRGHDMMADFPLAGAKEKYKRIGNAWEKFTDCLIDIKAWIDFAQKVGYNDIILQGHSLGAVKVVYYLTKTKDKRVSKLLLASPPDMVRLTEKWKHYKEMLDLAKRMVKKKGKEILPKQLDEWYYISAQTYVDFAERGNPIDVFNIYAPKALSALSEINIPIFAFIGSKDWCTVIKVNKALEILKHKAKKCPRFATAVVEGAAHSYFGHEQEVAKLVVNWLNK